MERTRRSGMLLLMVVVFLAVFAMPAEAASKDAEIKALKKQMAAMQRSLKALEAKQANVPAVNQKKVEAMVTEAMASKTSPDWVSNILNFEGELRYQHVEVDDEKNKPEARSNDVRGRITVYGAANEETDVVMRVVANAVQEELDGDAGGDKDVTMEFMYFDWHPGTLDRLPFIGTGVDLLEGVTPWYRPGSFDGAHVIGGRIPYPYYHPVNSNISFDGPDLDGIAITMKNPIGDNIEVFGAAGGYWLDEVDSAADASFWGAQVGFTWLVPDMKDTYATAAIGYYDYGNVEGATVGDTAAGSDNTTPGDVFANDYDLLVLNGEISFPACPGVPLISEFPVTIFGEMAENLAGVTGDTDAWLVGLSVGEIADAGDWQFVYNYRKIGKDAAFDSHNAGFGMNVDVTGHVFELGYKLAKNTSLAAAYEMGRQDVSADTEDYDALTLGVTVAF